MAIFVRGNWENENDFANMIPCELLDQHFRLGLSPTDCLAPIIIPQPNPGSPRWLSYPRRSGSTRRLDQHAGDSEQFRVNLDVQQFAPGDVQVRVADNSVVVEAKHEERQDEHGFISRQFIRRYVLPEEHDVEQVESTLSSDGVLTITAPKKATGENKDRVIPIMCF